MSIIKKIYSVLVTIFTVIVLIFGLVTAVPPIFGIKCYTVKSGSMEPVLQVGALTYINTNNTTPDVDDIAVYRIDDKTFVCHRVVRKTDDGYIFKGDANNSPDSVVVSQENIVGTYIFDIPEIGYILSAFNRFKIFMLIILLVALNISVIIIENTDKNRKVN